MDYKNFKLKLKELDEKGVFEGYASVFNNVDLVDDVVEKGAFKKTISENPQVPILWQHHIDKPIGVTRNIDEDGHGLKVVGELNLETTLGKEAYSLLKQGAIKGLSIGYQVIKDTIKEGIRYLKELKLFEYSLVTIPANMEANVVSVKKAIPYQDLPLADEGRAWDSTAADRNVRRWASSDGSGSKESMDWQKYQKAFFYVDEADPENFTSYKLGFADVINDRLYAIPRGIFAVAAVLRGARGGVDIPASDKQTITNNVNKYYSKMDRESPLKSAAKIEDTLYMLDVMLEDSMFNKGVVNFDIAKLIKKLQLFIYRNDSIEPLVKNTQADSNKLELQLNELLKTIKEG
jgi:HK97 family phage prohead protease